MALEDIRNERLKKLALLKERGISAYPATSERTTTIKDLLSRFDEAVDTEKVTVAGRVLSIREHGGSIFFNISDGTGTIQGYVKQDELPADVFSLFVDVVDIGDFIDLMGVPMRTKRGEPTVLASGWRMLTKSIRTLPEKWAGLTDPEERLRKRYLDILSHSELKEMFEKRALFWDRTRTFLKDKGFLEVETPTLEITTGGAEARPFITHHNDFDINLYLRISVGELWQKRLLAAGFPRTFEVGRVYRNEGTSAEHVQEFTNFEFYAAYMDYEGGIAFTEELIRDVATSVFGTSAFSTRGFTFDLKDTWERLDYVSTVEKMTGVNVLNDSEEVLKQKLQELHVEHTGENRERLTDTLWKFCRKQITGPAWLMNHPKLVSPLSKVHPDNPLLTQRVQLLLAGSEMTNGFAELNDPVDQKERFLLQQKLIDAGDTEAMMPDWEFVEMLEHGMPPAFGFAYGDRLFAFLVDKPIRETQLFPLMRPKKE
ncbi:MAG: lysine--tRNA ligase [Patescibacteria group bacterium]